MALINITVQVAVDQDGLFIVGCTLSNHPVDTYEAIPTAEPVIGIIKEVLGFRPVLSGYP